MSAAPTVQKVDARRRSAARAHARRRVGPLIAPLAYLVLLILGEVTTTFISARAGIIVHAGVLCAILVHAAVQEDDAQQRFLLALSLAPMVRILSLSLPLQHVQIKYWYILDAVPWAAGAIVVARLLRLSRRELSLTLGSLPVQLVIATTGIGLGMIEYAILRPKPLIAHFSWGAFWLPALILMVGTGFTEEFIFRGVVLSASRRLLGRLTILYVSIVFAVLHTGYRSIVDLLFVFGVGLLYACCVSATGSILGAALSHGIANLCLYLILPFVSVAGYSSAPPRATVYLPKSERAPVSRAREILVPAASAAAYYEMRINQSQRARERPVSRSADLRL